MKRLSFLAFIALSALTTACNQEGYTKHKKDLIDPTKLVHNPRTINGIPPEEAANLPVLTFADTAHNFGTIKEGEKVTYDFAFANTGKSPLLINSAEGSCGCTVADYPREPIPPGKSAVMKVVFASAGKQGHQEKTVAINTNTERGLYYLYVEAEVIPQSN
jgi:hypothetical protein